MKNEKQITTEEELRGAISDTLRRKIHQDSSQQGAEYLYARVLNEMEWQVFGSKVDLATADEILANLAKDIAVEAKTVNPDYLNGLTPYSNRESKQKVRSRG